MNEINYDDNMKMLSSAIKYCEENFLHEDIINELYNDEDLKKQLCLIILSKVENQQEADILVKNLTGHSSPVREAASFKILELIQKPEFNNFFQTKEILNSFVDAIIDINPSVSRNAVEIIKFVVNKQYIYNKIIEGINKILLQTDENNQKRSYTKNKQNFSLYWLLEAVSNISNDITALDELTKILIHTAKSKDYTIREKTAKTARAFKLTNILDLLISDSNIYVRKYL